MTQGLARSVLASDGRSVKAGAEEYASPCAAAGGVAMFRLRDHGTGPGEPPVPGRVSAGKGMEDSGVFDWVTGMVERTGYLGIALLMLAENVFPPSPRS